MIILPLYLLLFFHISSSYKTNLTRSSFVVSKPRTTMPYSHLLTVYYASKTSAFLIFTEKFTYRPTALHKLRIRTYDNFIREL